MKRIGMKLKFIGKSWQQKKEKNISEKDETAKGEPPYLNSRDANDAIIVAYRCNKTERG